MGCCVKCLTWFGVVVLIAAAAIGLLLRAGPFTPPACALLFQCTAPTVGGTVLPGFEGVRKAFEQNFIEGSERGAQLYLSINGKVVADLWGSNHELNHVGRAYTADSLQIVFSSTKVMESLVIAMLADRGLLSFSEPIAKYWPEFAQNGKHAITVAQLMRHEAGLENFGEPIPYSVFLSGVGLAELIEAAEPAWHNSSRRAYHGLTRGLIANQLVRRVDPRHRSLGAFFEEEVRKPLEVQFWIGLPQEQDANVHDVRQWPTLQQMMRVLVPCLLGTAEPNMQRMFKAFTDPKGWVQRGMRALEAFGTPQDFSNFEALRTVNPSAGGVANARSLGTILSVLAAGGTLGNVTLLSPAGLRAALTVDPSGATTDAAFGIHTTFTETGWGTHLDVLLPDLFGGNCWYGWGGWGGSIAIFCPKNRAVFAYTITGMGPGLVGDGRTFAVLAALRTALRATNSPFVFDEK